MNLVRPGAHALRLLPLAVLLSGCAGAPLTPDDGRYSEDGVREAAEQWIGHFTAGDLDGLMALYADDPFVALHGQPAMRGRQAVRTYFDGRIGAPGVAFRIAPESISIRGDTAILVSKYWFEVPRTDAAAYRDAGRSLIVYHWDDARGWLLATDIDQSTPDVRW
ncbi:MAG: nuclear transport factor 2 family protein [Pseudomonadota bacterium]